MRLVGRLGGQLSEERAVPCSDNLAAATEQLRVDEAEQRYRWLLDHSPVAIGVHVDGRYVYVNETLVQKMAAQSADQFLGRLVTDFVHPDSLPAVHAHLAAHRDEGDIEPPGTGHRDIRR